MPGRCPCRVNTRTLPAILTLVFACLFGAGVSYAGDGAQKAKIKVQPQKQTVEYQDPVTFTVQVESATPVTYQWRKNKVNIQDATEASYTIDSVKPTDAGNYDVIVTNAGGDKKSNTVKLTVIVAPETLPVGTAIFGEMTYQIFGQKITESGSYVITGATTVVDPENPNDHYFFTYERLKNGKARMSIYGNFYDSDIGDTIVMYEDYELTFTGTSLAGNPVASAKSRGALIPPAGYSPSKVGFTSKGVLEFAPPAP